MVFFGMEENAGESLDKGQESSAPNNAPVSGGTKQAGGSGYGGGEIRKRNIAFKLRIGDILKGRPMSEEGKFIYLEIGGRRVVRINILANCVDKFTTEGEKQYMSINMDDTNSILIAGFDRMRKEYRNTQNG